MNNTLLDACWYRNLKYRTIARKDVAFPETIQFEAKVYDFCLKIALTAVKTASRFLKKETKGYAKNEMRQFW